MRLLQLLLALLLLLLLQHLPVRGLWDSQQCRSIHGHCRILCFHMERWQGSCSHGHLRCCR
ncbi:GLL13 protein, partial [Bucco capensis]|nr:GLL13 protein [Bucco capensis]